MNRILYPLIFLMSSLPNTDTHLENLNMMVQAAQDSIRNIKTGLENFHNMMVELNQAGGKQAPPKAVENVKPQQKIEYGEKVAADSAPSILIPVMTPPDSSNF
ncbi:MAG: hypothetical protein ACYC0Q_01920 [Eubacteriales bacterium]